MKAFLGSRLAAKYGISTKLLPRSLLKTRRIYSLTFHHHVCRGCRKTSLSKPSRRNGDYDRVKKMWLCQQGINDRSTTFNHNTVDALSFQSPQNLFPLHASSRALLDHHRLRSPSFVTPKRNNPRLPPLALSRKTGHCRTLHNPPPIGINNQRPWLRVQTCARIPAVQTRGIRYGSTSSDQDGVVLQAKVMCHALRLRTGKGRANAWSERYHAVERTGVS